MLRVGDVIATLVIYLHRQTPLDSQATRSYETGSDGTLDS